MVEVKTEAEVPPGAQEPNELRRELADLVRQRDALEEEAEAIRSQVSFGSRSGFRVVRC
jgi:hypothetical protein